MYLAPEGGVAARQVAGSIHQLFDGFGRAAGREKVADNGGCVVISERPDLYGDVAPATVAPPRIAPREHLRTCQAKKKNGAVQILHEEFEQLERIVVRPLH